MNLSGSNLISNDSWIYALSHITLDTQSDSGKKKAYLHTVHVAKTVEESLFFFFVQNDQKFPENRCPNSEVQRY